MILTADQVAGVRQGKVTAAFIPQSETPRIKGLGPGGIPTISHPLRSITKEFRDIDGEGKATGEIRRERIALRVTVIEVARHVVVSEVSEATARACGFQNAKECREDWKRRHPVMDLATLIRFRVGDTRDPSLYLTSTSLMRWDVDEDGHGTGDYTSSRHQAADNEAEALQSDALAALAATNRQKDVRRKADIARPVINQPLSARIRRIEDAGQGIVEDMRSELYIISQRVIKAERKLARSA